MTAPQKFDPYAYAAAQAPPAASFDPYQYAATTSANPDYVAPTMQPSNTWGEALSGAPQAIEAGINRFGLDIAGIPADFANNVANLAKAGIGYTESKFTGRAPPAWTQPTNPVDVPGTSEWLKAKAKEYLGPSSVEVTGDPRSYLDQGLAATFEQTGPAPLLSAIPGSVELNAERAAAENPQTLSAAAAAPDLTRASPELRQAVQAAKEQGVPINPAVLERHVQAESLPVPAKLTLGQATQDPVMLSTEQNQRGANGAFAAHFNAQNQNLAANMQALREQIGPDVFSTNQTEHGDTLINAYKAKDQAAENRINAAYDRLRQANGGQFPVNAKALSQNVDQALHQNLLYEHAPSAEMAQLKRLADSGKMTLEQFEAMRTNLARIMRSSADGNEKAAAGIIRQQMEDLPLSTDTAQVKGLADQARALARAHFQELDADPAYKAAVNDKVPPDRFVNRFIVNGTRDNLAKMRENLADDEIARQTMGTAALEHLRESARLDDQYRGNFASASYNKALQAMGPKLNSLFTPQHIEDLSNLGDVARYETAQPRGSYVNTSNTDVARFAREHGANLAEGVANAKTFGIGGTIVRKLLKGRAERALAREHLAAGAGLTYQGSPP